MTSINEFFPTQIDFDHPKLRYWSHRKATGAKVSVEFRREREGLSFRPARLYVLITGPNGIEAPDELAWDAELNDAMINAGIAAVSSSNETERFGYAMRHMFSSIEIRHGDGFFNAVLVYVLRLTGLSQQDQVGAVLNQIREYSPHLGRSYEQCADAIKAVLTHCGFSLVKNLKYERGQAEVILGGAIAYYLDERFSVTNRQILGLGPRSAAR